MALPRVCLSDAKAAWGWTFQTNVGFGRAITVLSWPGQGIVDNKLLAEHRTFRSARARIDYSN